MVVHDPGEWFDEVLEGLARQDYGNLKHLFLVAGEPGELPARIRAPVPGAFVRAVGGNPGFGTASNEVLRLVEGDNGFFCFLHDDVALDEGAVRLLVEELYRSNAGIVGPKLVTWDEPTVLQHVGLGVDRFGEVDSFIEPGEYDQEQHDAVRDVFAVPSACLLVRADLFRTIGGFDTAIEYQGDDVDLCWRAHLSGARVLVVPAARARHREALAERRPDLALQAAAARARMRSVVTLTGARRLPLVTLQLVVATVVESLVSALTGRFRQAVAALGALLGLVVHTPANIARRRTVAPLRHVPDTEVAGLQLRGSARLAGYMRARDSRPIDPEAGNERRWRQSAGSAPALTWVAVLVLFAIGSRHLIIDGVPQFGQFLRFPTSPAGMWSDYMSGWSGHGLGSSSAVPTGVGFTALASVVTLFHMGLLHTIAIVGLLLAGYLGAWRLATVFPSVRSRITVLLVYAAVPLPSELMSAGRWGALVCYAAAPWFVHLLRRAAGIDTQGAVADTDTEVLRPVTVRRTVRLFAQVAMVAALAFMLAPAVLLLLVGIGIVLAVATLLCGGTLRTAGLLAAGSLVAALAAALVNLPWAASFTGSAGWTAIVGVPVTTARSLGLARLVQMGVGVHRLGALATVLLVPVFVAPLLARSWRFVWAVRAAGLVAVFGALAILDDRSALPFRMPEPGIMLVPVAVGVALAAGCIVASFDADVLAGSFGWRQPLGVLATVAVAVGVVPGLLAVGGGRWNMPAHTLQSVMGEFSTNPPEGDYRILWIGDPRAIPVASYTYQPGVGYAITDDGPLTVHDYWSGRPSTVEKEVADAVHKMAGGYTLRGGRLLAQYGIRYVVVPVADGFNGTISAPLAPPYGLTDVLDDQLDLSSPLTRPPNFIVYENTAYTPTRSVLASAGAAASKQAGGEAVAQSDLRGSTPFAVAAPARGDATGKVAAGTLHVAVPFDRNWKLTVDGASVPGRRAFGSTLAFDVPAAGTATLHYDTPVTRLLWVLVQLLMWLALAVAASTVQPSRWLVRRRMLTLDDPSPVADLTAPIEPLVLPPPAADDGPEPSWSDEGDDPFWAETGSDPLTIVDAPAAPDQGGDAS